MGKIRILLAEDHTIVRKGLCALLEDAPDIEVIAEASDGRDAVLKVELMRPHVVLMDISMPLLSGLEATRQIVERFPKVRILILTVHSTEEYILQTLRAGASGYLLKEAAPTELIRAIQLVHDGKAYLSPTISTRVIRDYVEKADMLSLNSSYDRLTNREREVLQLIAEGYSVKEIATHLALSEKTIRAHRSHLMDKLDIHSTAALTLYALRHGMITLD